MNAIKFGASVSTSGRYALQGGQALAGLRAWFEATNSEGGVRMSGLRRRVPVTLIHYNDASSPAQAAVNAERLIRVDRVDVLLGPYASDLTDAVAGVAARYRRVLWNHGGAADDIHGGGRRVVGVLTPVSRYFTRLLDMARTIDQVAKTVVVLHRRGSSFGRLAARGAEAKGRRLGFSVVTLAYSSLHEDLPRLSASLRRQRPDLILSAGSFRDECTLAGEIIAYGVKAKACGFVSAAMQEFREALGADAEGFLGPSQWEAGLSHQVDFGPTPQEVAQRIAAVGAPVNYPAAQAYAACLIAQRCLEEAGSADDEALWPAACALDCTTFFGRFRINPRTGLQVGHAMVWVQWQSRRKVLVWPPEVAEATPVYPRV